MRFYVGIFFALMSLCLLSCKKGAETTQNRNITTPFNTLQVFGKVQVYFKQDTTKATCSVSVETGSAMLGKVSTQVVDSVLQIKNNNSSWNYDSVVVYITAPHITYFIQDGVGNIYAQNTIVEKNLDYNLRNSGNMYLQVNTQTLTGHIFGIGDGYLSGQTQQHFVNVKGESFLYAKDLNVVAYCFVYFYSTGEAHVNVSGELDADIEYTGDIYYSGNPSVLNKQIIGSGKLTKE